jgi:hypothetical protein
MAQVTLPIAIIHSPAERQSLTKGHSRCRVTRLSLWGGLFAASLHSSHLPRPRELLIAAYEDDQLPLASTRASALTDSKMTGDFVVGLYT